MPDRKPRRRRTAAVNEAEQTPSPGAAQEPDLSCLTWEQQVELAENLDRKNLTQAEKAAIQRRLIAQMSGGSPKKPGSPRDLVQESSPTARDVGASRRTRWENATEKVARIFGEGEKVVRERLKVVQAAEENPEKYGDLLQEMEETGNVHGAFEVLQGRRTMRSLKSSKSTEWYTPQPIIDAAREVLGRIDLDPASSEIANRVVRAEQYFTIEQDGLRQEWRGHLWLNPPYSRKAGAFVKKAFEAHVRGQVTEAILLLNGYSYDASWFWPMWGFTLCFARNRIDFYSPDGPSKYTSGHGSVFIYIGPDWRRFARVFGRFGRVVRAVDLPETGPGGDDDAGDDGPPGGAPVPAPLPPTVPVLGARAEASR